MGANRSRTRLKCFRGLRGVRRLRSPLKFHKNNYLTHILGCTDPLFVSHPARSPPLPASDRKRTMPSCPQVRPVAAITGSRSSAKGSMRAQAAACISATPMTGRAHTWCTRCRQCVDEALAASPRRSWSAQSDVPAACATTAVASDRHPSGEGSRRPSRHDAAACRGNSARPQRGKSLQVSGGLHGRVSVVNALSTWLKLTICATGRKFIESRWEARAALVVGAAMTSGGTEVTSPSRRPYHDRVRFRHAEHRLRELAF